MAKKVVATLKTSSGKGFAKVVRVVKSPKTGAYSFKDEIIPTDKDNDGVKNYFKK
jgi:hypothetical protein